MSDNSTVDSPSPIALTYPSPAHLHVGGHLRVSVHDVRNYTEEGWRELYQTDSFWIEAPPAYQREDHSLPSYHHVVRRTATPSPTPLAKRLLKFGFIFPLLWLIGGIIMFVALYTRRSTRRSPLLPEKVCSHREMAYYRMLGEEIEWGLRCLWAFSVFSCILSGIVIAVMV